MLQDIPPHIHLRFSDILGVATFFTCYKIWRPFKNPNFYSRFNKLVTGSKNLCIPNVSFYYLSFYHIIIPTPTRISAMIRPSFGTKRTGASNNSAFRVNTRRVPRLMETCPGKHVPAAISESCPRY